MPWLRQLVSGLSEAPFMPGAVHVEFVVNKVMLGWVFLQVLWFSPVNMIPLWLSKLSIYVSSGGRTIGLLVAEVTFHPAIHITSRDETVADTEYFDSMAGNKRKASCRELLKNFNIFQLTRKFLLSLSFVVVSMDKFQSNSDIHIVSTRYRYNLQKGDHCSGI
jgi:hypothetical protein